MAFKLVDKRCCLSDFPCEYIVDTESDIMSLPECCTGSTAIVVESGAVYMVNASGKWVEFGGC